MNTTSTPAHPPTSGNSNWVWATVFGIVIAVPTTLIILVAMALAKFEDGLTQHGYVKGPGTVTEPLRAGGTARYDDGLTITVSPPHREPDDSYSFTITYDNGTDKELRPGGTPPHTGVGTTRGYAPVVVRAGKAMDSGTPSPTFTSSAGLGSAPVPVPAPGVTFLDQDASVTALTPSLDTKQKRTVPVRVKPDREGSLVTVEVAPESSGYRETAYWQFDLS
ncbi:hypothetical protein [Kitasatospora xanthocidica]|uniref:hypothetical protein n=1 Tax=Kitasatospora xanthocidica TaxID=83382 RepID=UPI001E3FB7C3|nr:hypothetical protein [Kitasatospora xanthocidica]